MIRAILYMLWWSISITLFIYTLRDSGLVPALIAWINPLSPP